MGHRDGEGCNDSGSDVDEGYSNIDKDDSDIDKDVSTSADVDVRWVVEVPVDGLVPPEDGDTAAGQADKHLAAVVDLGVVVIVVILKWKHYFADTDDDEDANCDSPT